MESRRVKVIERKNQPEEGMAVASFPLSWKGTFLSKIERLQRRANKLDVQPPSWVELHIDEREVRHHFASGAVGPWFYDRWLTVGIRTAPVRLSGWRMVAVLQHAPAGNIVRSIDESLSLPIIYRTCGAFCDHCKKSRRRKDTYVVYNDETGEFMRVGKSCLADFTSEEEGLGAIPLLSSLVRIMGDLDELDGYAGRGKPYADMGSFMAHVCAYARVDGFLTRSSVQNTGSQSTSDSAFALVAGLLSDRAESIERRRIQITAADRERAAEVLAWARAIEDTSSNYLHNLKVSASFTNVEARDAGIVASAYKAHAREQEKAAQQQMVSQGILGQRHFGNPGDKIGRKLSKKDREAGKSAFPAMKGKIVKVYSSEGAFGVSTMFKFHVENDGQVDIFVWWSSSRTCYDSGETMDAGDEVEIIGTIKRHKDFKGIKETELTRAVVNLISKAAAAA